MCRRMLGRGPWVLIPLPLAAPGQGQGTPDARDKARAPPMPGTRPGHPRCRRCGSGGQTIPQRMYARGGGAGVGGGGMAAWAPPPDPPPHVRKRGPEIGGRFWAHKLLFPPLPPPPPVCRSRPPLSRGLDAAPHGPCNSPTKVEIPRECYSFGGRSWGWGGLPGTRWRAPGACTAVWTSGGLSRKRGAPRCSTTSGLGQRLGSRSYGNGRAQREGGPLGAGTARVPRSLQNAAARATFSTPTTARAAVPHTLCPWVMEL